MLPSDHESFHRWNNEGDEKTIAPIIAARVTDKELLKNTIIGNIKKGTLAIPVIYSHFTICHKLHYKECLPELYAAALSENSKDYTLIKLVEYYLDLGGEITDFTSHLKVPVPPTEENQHSSWEWFLIEKLEFIEPEKIKDILFKVLNDPLQAQNKIRAAEFLIHQSKS